jgi:rubrerythrin
MERLMREALALLKEEPKHGRWIEESDRERHWHCSVCGYTAGIAAKTYKHCPECGAKMEEEDHEDA